jgi:hypothetical protein
LQLRRPANVFLVNGGAHCSDLNFPESLDLNSPKAQLLNPVAMPSVLKASEKFLTLAKKWLEQGA